MKKLMLNINLMAPKETEIKKYAYCIGSYMIPGVKLKKSLTLPPPTPKKSSNSFEGGTWGCEKNFPGKKKEIEIIAKILQ
jgi:hypothetical protein